MEGNKVPQECRTNTRYALINYSQHNKTVPNETREPHEGKLWRQRFAQTIGVTKKLGQKSIWRAGERIFGGGSFRKKMKDGLTHL